MRLFVRGIIVSILAVAVLASVSLKGSFEYEKLMEETLHTNRTCSEQLKSIQERLKSLETLVVSLQAQLNSQKSETKIPSSQSVSPSNGIQIPAVQTGFPVRYSSHKNGERNNYLLDGIACGGGNPAAAWCPAEADGHQWIQVSSLEPKNWTGITTQGTGDFDFWTTKYIVVSTLDGEHWYGVDQDRVFDGNTDRYVKVHHDFFEPVYARTIRIYPLEWNGFPCLRFEAYLQA